MTTLNETPLETQLIDAALAASAHGLVSGTTNWAAFVAKHLGTALAQQGEPSDLVKRLRETASKGVSVWGDLQMEAAKEIEILTAERELYASAMDRMKTALAQQGPYKDSTPELSVGDSSFEGWYATYSRQGVSKQVARDAYAAGMGDPLVKALAQPTSGDYALGYAEGFNDACKPAPQGEKQC